MILKEIRIKNPEIGFMVLEEIRIEIVFGIAMIRSEKSNDHKGLSKSQWDPEYTHI